MTINTQTFEGLAGGMDLNIPPHDLPTNKARYIQDVLLDVPGIIRRRGIVKKLTGFSATIGSRTMGIAGTTDPAGVSKLAIFAGAVSSAAVWYLPDPFTGAGVTDNVYMDHARTNLLLNPTSPRNIVDAHSALGGGALIGIASSHLAGAAQAGIWYWRGATKASFTSGSNVTATLSSKTVTSTVDLTSNVEVGHFMFNNASPQVLVGVVAAIDFGVTTGGVTTITLEDKALIGIAAGIANFRTFRGINLHVGKGVISVASGGTAVTGVGTKFKSQGVNNGTWDIFKLADMTYVGTVNTVSSDTDLTLTTGAAQKVSSSERWVAIRRGHATAYDADVTGTNNSLKVGFLNAVWGGRQWYANRPVSAASATTTDYPSRVWFSDISDLEMVDTSKDDGDFLNIVSSGAASSPIMAIVGTANGLAILKEQELFVVVGTDRSNFTPRKVAQVGTVANGSVQAYAGGMIFADKTGIYFFDGVRLENLGAPLGNEYMEAMKGFNSSTKRCWSMISRDHYILNIESYAPTVKPVINGTTFTRTEMTFIINMRTGAIGTLTNFDLRGAVQMPASTGQSTLYVIHDSSPTTWLCDAQYLWNGTGVDVIKCESQAQLGPWFYIESRRYDLGDGERKKLFKQLAMNYSLQGAVIGMDTLPGLTSTGTRTANDWQTNADYTNKRIKFLKRSTHIGFRYYEVTPGTVTDFRIGPYAIGFKQQRPGRV